MLNKIKKRILKERADYYIDKRVEYHIKAKKYYEAHDYDNAMRMLDRVQECDEKWSKVALKLMNAGA